MLWKMRDGKEIHMKDMTTLHIQNCVNMLERNLVTREEFKKINDLFAGVLSELVPHVPEKTELAEEGQNFLNTNEDFQKRYLEAQEKTREQIKTFKQELLMRETN